MSVVAFHQRPRLKETIFNPKPPEDDVKLNPYPPAVQRFDFKTLDDRKSEGKLEGFFFLNLPASKVGHVCSPRNLQVGKDSDGHTWHVMEIL